MSTELCAHTYVEDRKWEDNNPVMGTWDRGMILKCSKCGRETYRRDSYNNWSGD